MYMSTSDQAVIVHAALPGIDVDELFDKLG